MERWLHRHCRQKRRRGIVSLFTTKAAYGLVMRKYGLALVICTAHLALRYMSESSSFQSFGNMRGNKLSSRQERSAQEAGHNAATVISAVRLVCKLLRHVSYLAYSSTLKMETICSSITWALSDLHGAAFLKTTLSTVTAVRTSDSTSGNICYSAGPGF
jgi:hypothetical protein